MLLSLTPIEEIGETRVMTRTI